MYKNKALLLLVSAIITTKVAFADQETSFDDHMLDDADQEIISEAVEQELDQQLEELVKKQQTSFDDYLPHDNKAAQAGKASIYMLPHMPFYSLYFGKQDLIQTSVSFEFSPHAYDHNGKQRDLATSIFGTEVFTVKDMLLASKLLSLEKIQSVSPMDNPVDAHKNHFLGILADQPVAFHATCEQACVSFNYARNFAKGLVALGFHVPVKVKHQKITLANDITPDNMSKLDNVQNNLHADGTSYTAVPSSPAVEPDSSQKFNTLFDSFEKFITTMLQQKGIDFNKDETITGIGDITAYLNLSVPTHYVGDYVSQWLCGASLQMPTASGVDGTKLWDQSLGNGGFPEVAGYTSCLLQYSRWVNPYIHCKVSYMIPSTVTRRVPKINTYQKSPTSSVTGNATFNGINLSDPFQPIKGYMVMGESLTFAGQDFAQADSSVRNCADQLADLKIAPGVTFFARAGNTIDAVLSEHGFLDVYYDFYVKGSSSVDEGIDRAVWDPGVLVTNSDEMLHTVGASYSYQLDSCFRARLGGWYGFAGKNSVQTGGVQLLLNAEF